jgi:putative holliday junction resolvase
MSELPASPASVLFPFGRLAGVDFGTVRIGIATCDPSQNWVTPFGTYVRRNENLDALYLMRLAETESLVGWVVGLPIHCDGQESQKSREVRHFAKWLREATAREVALFDERFTTAEARRLLETRQLSARRKKNRLDGLAAHLILTHFLDSQRHGLSQNEALEDLAPPD